MFWDSKNFAAIDAPVRPRDAGGSGDRLSIDEIPATCQDKTGNPEKSIITDGYFAPRLVETIGRADRPRKRRKRVSVRLSNGPVAGHESNAPMPGQERLHIEREFFARLIRPERRFFENAFRNGVRPGIFDGTRRRRLSL